MYTPPMHRVDDRETLVGFMRAHPIATLVTHGEGGLRGTHLPVHVALEDGGVVLYAHMAHPNPQWRDFAAGGEAMAVFLEAHAFVSPRHYANPVSVPTWNYAAVHAYGAPRLIEASGTAGINGHTILRVESGAGQAGPWRDDRVSGSGKIIFLTITAQEKAARLVDLLAPNLESWGMVLTMGDVEVVRPERF